MSIRFRLFLIGLLGVIGCTSTEVPDTLPATDSTIGSVPATTTSEAPSTTLPEPTFYFATLAPGSELPDEATCAEQVLVDPSIEFRPENAEANSTIPTLDPADELAIDGADEVWNDALAPRITGNFTGTTEQVLRWGACKWGFDEDVTRARAVTESSWLMSTAGDETDDPELCGLMSLEAPCAQSHGLLQVKGSVHEGTFPTSSQASAFGVDYAMAWLRACYEGSFVWLLEGNADYAAGDEFGCVGAWFSGNWWDQPANDYVGEVRAHLEDRTWLQYQP